MASNTVSPGPSRNAAKPEIPYRFGAQFKIFHHVPALIPTPSDGRSQNSWLNLNPDQLDHLKSKGQLTHCLLNPPLEGVTDYSRQQTIRIVDEIAVEDGGAQVVAIHGNLVAKIYDPVYYRNPTTDRKFYPTNPTSAADADYIRESSAYVVLNPKLGGLRRTTLPRLLHHGHPRTAWSSSFQTRYTREQREAVITKCIDAESLVRGLGIIHGDLYPRNFVVSGSPLSNKFRVVLLDFGRAVMADGGEAKRRTWCDDGGRAVSPVLSWRKGFRWYRSFMHAGWLDEDWLANWDQWVEKVWGGRSEYAVTTEMKEFWNGALEE